MLDFKTTFTAETKVTRIQTIKEQKTSTILEVFDNMISISEGHLLRLLDKENPNFKGNKNDLKKYRSDEVDKFRKLFIKDLEEGKIIHYENHYPATIFITGISLAYLTLCSPPMVWKRNRTEGNNQDNFGFLYRNFVHKRDHKGRPVDFSNNEINEKQKYYCSPYLIDLQGGIFINSFIERRSYMKIRSALFGSIIDFALKRKIRYFK
jgi:hypothetical protein